MGALRSSSYTLGSDRSAFDRTDHRQWRGCASGLDTVCAAVQCAGITGGVGPDPFERFTGGASGCGQAIRRTRGSCDRGSAFRVKLMRMKLTRVALLTLGIL